MTFGEFAKQCELFEYSQEYFDLYKEASELDLMSLFIEQQQFLSENAYIVESSGLDGYFAESALSADDVEDRFYEAHQSFMGKVRKKLSSMMAAIARFFRNLINRITGQKLEREGIREAFKKGGVPRALQNLWGKVGDNWGSIVTGLGITGAVVGSGATIHALHLDRQLKAEIETFVRKQSLSPEQAEYLRTTVMAQIAEEKDYVGLKTNKKVLSPGQIDKLDKLLDDLLDYLSGKSQKDPTKELANEIASINNDRVHTVEIACTEQNYNEFANKFAHMERTIKAIEVMEIPEQIKKGADAADYYKDASRARNGEPDTIKQKVSEKKKLVVRAAGTAKDRYKIIMNTLHGVSAAVADTTSFYATWSKLMNEAHRALMGSMVKGKINEFIDTVGGMVDNVTDAITGKNKKEKDASNESEPAKEEAPAEGATA